MRAPPHAVPPPGLPPVHDADTPQSQVVSGRSVVVRRGEGWFHAAASATSCSSHAWAIAVAIATFRA